MKLVLIKQFTSAIMAHAKLYTFVSCDVFQFKKKRLNVRIRIQKLNSWFQPSLLMSLYITSFAWT